MISIVDLGVVADVRVEGRRVEVDFTPTFMGCPALDTMRAQMEDAIRALGAEPDVRVVLDDSWSTDRISRRGTREAARGRLCAAHAHAAPRHRRCSSSSAAPSAAPGAAPPTRASTTSSARRRAGRCATATPAASRSSSSRRSDGDERIPLRREPAASARGLRRVLREPAARGGAPARGSGPATKSSARRSGGSAAASRSSSGGSRTSTRRSSARTTASASGSTRSSSTPPGTSSSGSASGTGSTRPRAATSPAQPGS